MIKGYHITWSSPFEPLCLLDPHGLKNAEIFLVSVKKLKVLLGKENWASTYPAFLTSKQNVNSAQTHQKISVGEIAEWKATIGLRTP